MWDEQTELVDEELQFGKKPWQRRALIWSAAAIVPTALMINMAAPTIKTMAAERIYSQNVASHEVITNFAALTKHALPQAEIGVIFYVDLPQNWLITQATINGTTYDLQANHDCYLIELVAPTQLGHWVIELETVQVFDGAIYHQIDIAAHTEVEVETHIPHFEEVHPEKPKVQQDTQDTLDNVHDSEAQVGQKAKAEVKFKVSEGEKIKAIEKYALADDKNGLKKLKKLVKYKAEVLPEHGKIVAVFIQETLYPATIEADGQLQIYGLPETKQRLEIQYFVYEDGYVAPVTAETV